MPRGFGCWRWGDRSRDVGWCSGANGEQRDKPEDDHNTAHTWSAGWLSGESERALWVDTRRWLALPGDVLLGGAPSGNVRAGAAVDVGGMAAIKPMPAVGG